ncbi:synaptogyrin-3-like [Tubulanus polymorphus]|uniref:synaptogyrin-3-like n=1 Tax=Tubulanus polymorphus TaxID=672921 RepID=UPI003DA5D9B9
MDAAGGVGSVEGGAFGAGKAGAPFDPMAFIRKPQVILRIVSWLFAIVVFGCIRAGCWSEAICLYNGDSDACNYGTGIGVIAFLACLGFLVVDGLFDNISSVQHRKYAVIADLAFSGLWTFLWFVGFCYLTNRWSNTLEAMVLATNKGNSNAQAAIAFSFFSIGTWAGLTVLAVMRYRQGSAAAFAPSFESNQSQAPYSSYPGGPENVDPYQAPPFTGDKGPAPEYQPPTY